MTDMNHASKVGIFEKKRLSRFSKPLIESVSRSFTLLDGPTLHGMLGHRKMK